MDDTLVNLRSLDVDFSRESFERSRRSSLELSRRSSMDKPRTQLTQQLLRWDVDLATSSFGDLVRRPGALCTAVWGSAHEQYT